MRERDVERKLVSAVLARDGFAPKLSCPGMDMRTLILLPGGRAALPSSKPPASTSASVAAAAQASA